MDARIDVITLAVDDLERALTFYRDGLGLPTSGVIGTDWVGDEATPAGATVVFALRDGLMLTWARDRSSVYQFERLRRPPRLHKANEPNTEGTLEEGVRLLIDPPDGVPRVPDLLPVVRLER